MGPGNTLMNDIIWGLDSSQTETTQIRIIGNFGISNVAPAIEKPRPNETIRPQLVQPTTVETQ